MKNASKLAFCAVLLVLSLTAASSAFGAEMKAGHSNAIIGSSDPTEAYSGLTQASPIRLPVADLGDQLVGVDPNEGYAGVAIFKGNRPPAVGDSTGYTNSYPSEAYSGFNNPEVVSSDVSDAMASSIRSDSYRR